MGQKGFFTDTTLCIGCKACEVACKQWNRLPADGYEMTGHSYDNTTALSSTTWRHVAFVEQKRSTNGKISLADHPGTASYFRSEGLSGASRESGVDLRNFKTEGGIGDLNGKTVDWLMMSDVCKHCTHAGCMEACPTGAIIRNEFGDVYVQPDICNGCGYCVPSCPFGVIGRNEETGNAAKCTLCYDRQKYGIEPACAKACPTDSIVFGDLDELKEKAKQRVTTLRERNVPTAYLYGVDEDTSVGDLNAFFLLTDRPSVYNLPEKPQLPQNNVLPGFVASAITATFLTLATAISLWRGR